MVQKYQCVFTMKFSLVFFMITSFTRASVCKADNSSDVSSINDVSDLWPSQNEIDACRKDIHKCLDFPKYPSAHIEELIKKGDIKKNWFSKPNHEEEILDNTNKSGLKDLCQTKIENLYPKGGITKSGEFAYIIQMQVNDEYFHQEVMVLMCYKNTEPCNTGDANLDNMVHDYKYTYYCTDQHCSESNLIGIDKNMNVISDVSISKSCCCVCAYKPK